MYQPSIYNDVVPISSYKLFNKNKIAILFQLANVSRQNNSFSNFKRFSKGRHFTMEGLQNNKFCEVLEL